jgi:hypothetical protein
MATKTTRIPSPSTTESKRPPQKGESAVSEPLAASKRCCSGLVEVGEFREAVEQLHHFLVFVCRRAPSENHVHGLLNVTTSKKYLPYQMLENRQMLYQLLTEPEVIITLKSCIPHAMLVRSPKVEGLVSYKTHPKIILCQRAFG